MRGTDTRPGTAVPTPRRPVHDALSTAERKDRDGRREANAYREHRIRRPNRMAALICVIGLLLTGLSTWATSEVDQNAERRLLEGQSKQVSAVLSTAVLLFQAPLTNALSVQQMAGPRDPAAFRRSMASSVGDGKLFVSASLWQRRGGRMVQLAGIGVPHALEPRSRETQAYLQGATGKQTFAVKSVSTSGQIRIGYALARRGTGYVVYAERAIPANRRSPFERDSAFADLHYAIYLGPDATLDALSTTDVDPASLPLQGRTSTETVPFGDTVLTVVTSPRRHLGAALGERLPLILLLGGLLLTAAAAIGGRQLVLRRQNAEASASTITGLYDRVETLYGEQRELSVRLQRALLPHVIPDVPNLEVAAEYVAGAQGVDIGGDWYSIIGTGEEHFGFVVGDVSGRGVDAVAVMAHARFTLRAYLIDGDSPAVALDKCSHQFDIGTDGHMTTCVVGVGNWRTGEITLASAGHPGPLLLGPDGSSFVEVATGPPLGTGPATYRSVSFTMAPGATLFCFTDGLVERRTEDIDTGLRRLVATLDGRAAGPVAAMVTHAVSTLRSDDAPDDIAVLALRWRAEV